MTKKIIKIEKEFSVPLLQRKMKISYKEAKELLDKINKGNSSSDVNKLFPT